MSIPSNIEELAHKVRTEIYGRDVREALATSIEATAEVAEWSKEVAQQIIDGSFDEGALNTAIEQKLNDLEQEYAPQLTTIKNEVEDARGNQTSLAGRLDATDSQLAQNAENMLKEFLARSKPQYGYLKLPDDFIELDFSLYRHGNSLISHSIDLETFKRGQAIYVSTTGNNHSNNGSKELPYRTVHRAFYKINNTPGVDFKVYVDEEVILRGEFADEGDGNNVTLINKNVAIVSTNEKGTHVAEGQSSERNTFAQTGGERQPKLTWTLESGNVYKTMRSAVEYVVDLSYVDKSNDTVIKLEEVNSVEDCQAKKGSYYKTTTEVYVNTFDGRSPDKYIIPVMKTNPLNFELVNSTLYLEGFYFHSNTGLSVKGDLQSKFIQNKCKIGRTTSLNGLNLLDVGLTMSFNTIIHDSFKDCFNYHYYGIAQEDIRKVLAFEYYCEGFNAGIEDSMEGNNVTTMHEGANILRVGTIGSNTRGTPCADINGSYSVLFDCQMNGSIAGVDSLYNRAYYFVTDVNKSGLGAKVYMENCGGKATGNRSDIMLDEGTELTLKSYHEGLDGVELRGGELILSA